MATTKLTTTHPILTTLLPLVALALSTILAFILAIHSNYTSLASLWTSCARSPQFLLDWAFPTPLCFAIEFFQAAHATTHGRLEQAVIVSFLAGLATITAVEGAQVRRAGIAREKLTGKGQWLIRTGEFISWTTIANLTIPWLLYSLAFGALAWQGMIIPAFIYRRRRHTQTSGTDAGAGPDAYSATIPLSIVFGLFLPATVMLLHPTAPLPIILFLLFPLWVTLTHHLLSPLTSHLALPSKSILYAPPIIASITAHIAFLFTLFTPSSPQTAHHPAHAAALFLLELDHAAIFLAALYWIRLETGANGVLATLAATIALGPGAGVCVGWLCRCEQPIERRRSRKATGTFFGGLPA